MEQREQIQQVLSFANQYPGCHLATVDGDQPRVRGMLLWFADETGFYFHTGSVKNLPKQIRKSPKAEIAFIKPSETQEDMLTLRVSGNAEIMDDKELEERLFTERPWLLENLKQNPDGHVVIFRIKDCEAFFWDLTKNLVLDSNTRIKLS